MTLWSKDLLTTTDANEKFRFELLRSKLLPQFFKNSELVDFIFKLLIKKDAPPPRSQGRRAQGKEGLQESF